MTDSQRRAAADTHAQARNHLLEAAQHLVSTIGPADMTSRMIADHADVNLAAITYYFGSKQNLVAEAMSAMARALIEPVLQEMSRADVEPVAKMLDAVETLQRIIGEHRSWLPGYVQVMAAAVTDHSVGGSLAALFDELVSALAEVIEDQCYRGMLASWVEPEPMARLILATVNGVAVSTAINPAETHERAMGGQLVHLLLAARSPTT